MVDEEGQNLDRVINKIVWGILYALAFLAALPTVLDILTALF